MNLQFKFGYCIFTQTLIIGLCKRDRITDRQTDGQKDERTVRQTIQLLDARTDLSGIKSKLKGDAGAMTIFLKKFMFQ